MLLPNNINLRSLTAKAVTSLNAAVGPFKSKTPSGAPTSAVSPSPLLHPDIPYGREFAGVSSRLKSHFPREWLAMSVTGMFMSFYMNCRGFEIIFPNRPLPALFTALMLEGFVVGTGVLIGRANRRAVPGLVVLAVLMGGSSMELSFIGLNAGVQQTQQRLNLPEYEREDAVKAEGVFATSAARTEDAAIHRIGNEISFFMKHGGALGTARGEESNFARDEEQRRSNLIGLQAKWNALDFSDSFAAAKTPDKIWQALRHQYSVVQSLMAETNRLTSGRPIPMPAYPVPPDHEADAAHTGVNDATGAHSLTHPTLIWLVTLPLAVVMDLGPMVVAATQRAIESSDNIIIGDSLDSDPDGSEPVSLEKDWDERKRRMRRVNDDLQADPLAMACDSAIQAEAEAFRAVERGALSNLRVMRAFELFEEECAIVRDAAKRIGLKPEVVQEHLDDSFRRLQDRLRSERQIQDAESALRDQKRELEQKLQGANDRLAIARQIAGIQAELDALSGTHR